MKKSILLLFTLLSSLCTLNLISAQSIQASEIAKRILSGGDVSYENMTIMGDLDLTPYLEKKDDQPSKSWWSGDSNTIEHRISGKVEFVNCKFEGDLLAYIHDDNSGSTFIAHFDKQVIFKNCEFKNDIAFKYSDFEKMVDFSRSTIEGEANFKYAEFEEFANFSQTSFNELANFKYAEYGELVNFSSSIFNKEANFKYAEIKEGVDFTNTLFNDFLNFKYVELEGEVTLTNIQIKGDIDTKYAEINGEDFTAYLLRSK